MNPKEARETLHVSESTLLRWEKTGKITCTRTEGGHRRYDVKNTPEGRHIIYARVSSKKQEADLARQVQFLADSYPGYEVFQDIGSGINYERPQFRAILELLFRGNLAECVVSSKDRFARYGDFFTWLFERFNAKLTSVRTTGDDTEDLAADLMEIITVFSARYHGKRRYKISEKSETTSDSEPESPAPQVL